MSINITICTANHGYGDGVCQLKDFQYIKNFHEFKIHSYNLKKFPFCHINTIHDFLKKVTKSDLVIFPFHGSAMLQFIERFSFIDTFVQFWNSSIKKVAWTLDNHLFGQQDDPNVQQYFNGYYVAHSNHMSHLDKVNVHWLPCSYYLHDINSLIYLSNKKILHTIDLLCIFRYFPHHVMKDNRNIIAYKIAKILTQDFRNINFIFCNIPNSSQYIYALKSAKIILNISMANDFNIRNLECIGLNQVMLADKTVDHSKVITDYSNTFFFDRNLNNFHESLNKALSHKQKEISTVKNVINNHMLVHRYLFIINQQLNTSYCMNEIDTTYLHMKNDNMLTPVNWRNVEQYSTSDLLKKSQKILYNNK